MAKQQGLASAGPGGLPKQFTKTVPETALDEEMNEHLGRAKHEKSKDGRAQNARNGVTRKTVITHAMGPVDIAVPSDRDASRRPGHRGKASAALE